MAKGQIRRRARSRCRNAASDSASRPSSRVDHADVVQRLGLDGSSASGRSNAASASAGRSSSPSVAPRLPHAGAEPRQPLAPRPGTIARPAPCRRAAATPCPVRSAPPPSRGASATASSRSRAALSRSFTSCTRSPWRPAPPAAAVRQASRPQFEVAGQGRPRGTRERTCRAPTRLPRPAAQSPRWRHQSRLCTSTRAKTPRRCSTSSAWRRMTA